MDTQLRAYRRKLGLSQGELATQAGLSRQAINTIENGRGLPSLDHAMKLARILGASVEDVFGTGK